MYKYYKIENGNLYRIEGLPRHETISIFSRNIFLWNTIFYWDRKKLRNIIRSITVICTKDTELSEEEMNIEIDKLKMINELKK